MATWSCHLFPSSISQLIGEMNELITRQDQKTERKCQECQATFVPKHASRGIFCSKACKYKNGRRNYRATRDGYVWIYPDVDVYPDAKLYPGTTKDGRILEHRYVMQEHLGRKLLQTETVHHLNGQKHDNRIKNLELRTGNHGKGWSHDGTVCPLCERPF